MGVDGPVEHGYDGGGESIDPPILQICSLIRIVLTLPLRWAIEGPAKRDWRNQWKGSSLGDLSDKRIGDLWLRREGGRIDAGTDGDCDLALPTFLVFGEQQIIQMVEFGSTRPLG